MGSPVVPYNSTLVRREPQRDPKRPFRTLEIGLSLTIISPPRSCVISSPKENSPTPYRALQSDWIVIRSQYQMCLLLEASKNQIVTTICNSQMSCNDVQGLAAPAKNACIDQHCPAGIVCSSYAVILRSTAGQSLGKDHLSAAPPASAQTKQPNHRSSALPMPTRRRGAYCPTLGIRATDKLIPRYKQWSHCQFCLRLYTLHRTDKKLGVILISKPTSASSPWTLR